MTDNLRGILSVLIGSTAFVVNDALVKLVSAELPPSQIILIRGVMATILLVIGVLVLGARRPLAVLFTPMMLLRIFSAAAATSFVVFSLRELPLPIVNAVLQVTPLAVTAGAAIVFGEKVGPLRWLAALTGFLGVMMIVKPGGDMFGAAAYWILVALIFTTIRDLTTRGIDRSIPSIFVAAAGAAAIAVTGLAVAPFDSAWVPPSAHAWKLLCVSAVCLFFGNIFVVIGLRTGDLGLVAPFRYAPVPLALALGYWWWGHVPDALAFLGIGMVLGAGLFVLYRERLTLMARPAPAPTRSPAE